jgi:hypothetical protein
MTDGITLPGTGLNVDTEVSPTTSRHMQRVKLVLGAADIDGGDVSSINPIPASLASLPALSAGSAVIGAVTQSGAPWSFSLSGTATVSGSVSVSNFPATQAVSAASLPLPTGAATAANQPTNATAGSTTAGQTGNLNFAAVTTAAPTYTTGTSNFLSLTTAGALRVDGSAVTQPVSGTVGVSGSVAVTGTFWQATQPVSLASLPALAAGSNAIGSITNASFGISGTLPAFAATPTVNAAISGTWNVGLSAGSNTVGNVGVNNNAVGPASFATSQATITTTSSSAALAARTGAVGTGRVSVTIYNLGSQTAYLGTSTGVTSSTGIPILPGGSYTKRTTAALYAVTLSGSTTLAFDEEF